MTLEDLYRLLRAGHVQAQGVVDTMSQPTVVLDANLCVVLANPAFLRAFKVTRDETIGEKLSKLGNGQWDIPALTTLLEQVIPKSSAVIDYEVTHDFPEIGRKTMLVTARRLVHPDNNSLFMLVAFDDVTERRREEAGRDLLSREIEHRLKNFLALVTALARQVPADGEGIKYRDAFLERLEVLAKAELGLFSPDGNDLASLVASVLAPYGNRVKVERAALVKLKPSQIRTFSMILHELGTNALKHGALSVDGGTVSIGWSLSGPQRSKLTFDWCERDGPHVTDTGHEGFGTRLIKSLVRLDLGGTIDTKLEPGGVLIHLEAPILSQEQ